MLLSMPKSLQKIVAKFANIAIALTGGIAMGMTFAPVEAWYLAWIALVPLWYLSCRRGSGKSLYAFCWGLGCYGVALAWIFGIHPMTWMGVPERESLAIACFCWAFISIWGASLVLFWSLGWRFVSAKAKLNPAIRVIWGVTIWCVLERLYSLTDLWWTSLALSQSPHNLTIVHLGQISGPTTVTAVIVGVNGLIAEAALAIKKYAPQAILFRLKNQGELYGRDLYPEYLPVPKERTEKLTYVGIKIKIAAPYIFSAIALLISSHAIGAALVHRPPTAPVESAVVEVGIVQGNIGNELKHYRAGHDYAIERYTKGYRELADRGVDVVVTPETALPFTEDRLKNTSFYQAILEKKVTALVGAFGSSGRSFTNSILTIDSTGNIFSRYDKWKLVPLGEYIPLEQFIGKFIDRLSPLDSHLRAGEFAPIVNTPVGHIIFGICYDSAYAEHFRQQAQHGNFIVTASNDAHYGAGMAKQHHAQDIMRAIETDRWTVRASNTGYSAIIDPHGNTEWISHLNEFATHAHQIYRQHTQTLYVRFGDWLTPLLTAIGLLLLLLV